jgi:N-carbamoyl-L-amino-acid hydrolase
LDGTLGALGGSKSCAPSTTRASKRCQTLRDVDVGFFTEEEGVRFGTSWLG